ncbi:hypothetical protein Plhal304r1_c029g0095011 [Plasmopara halstedii]
MSTCPQCFTGTCRRHKQQDHGRSLIKSANAVSTLQKIYDQLVGSKLQRLEAEAKKDTSKQHTKEFRKQLDASRDKSLRKSRKSSVRKSKLYMANSGLNPQALAAIYDSDSDAEAEQRKRRKSHKHSTSKKRKRASKNDCFSDSSDDYSDLRDRHKKRKQKRKKKEVSRDT